MLTVDIVLETADTTGFTAWRVAALPPYRPLALTGRMTPDEVGSALAALTRHTLGTSDNDNLPAPDATALVRRLLAEEEITADGGLRFHHTGLGVTVRPGCCCGLADWRDWLTLAEGETPWLGHDPTPRVELTGTTVLLWPDGGFAPEPPPTRPVAVPLAHLPGLLRSARDDLRGFLDLVARWASRHIPDQAAELTSRLDTDLASGTPLPGEPDGPRWP
ncbi:hypothetical protein ACH4PU_14315 [Streptomyces sp. NPDC021100]|uniref:hypothetical protein n=1 Tax=Streptomyces sp. NPDC021100 TaxID=3365114 RepID=UPI00379B74B5